MTDGRIEWTGPRPYPGRHRVLVTVLDPPVRSPEQIQRVLKETYGAWGSGKSLNEIDAEI